MAIGTLVEGRPIYGRTAPATAYYNLTLDREDSSQCLRPLEQLGMGQPIWAERLPIDADIRVLGGFETTHNPSLTRAGGGRARSFYDLFYERIHYDPAVLRLGQLLNEQTRPLWVWNAFFEPRTLTAVQEVNNEGVSLDYGAVPQAFLPLQQKIFNVSVTVEGPPSINASFVFQWDNGDYVWRVDGERLVVFGYEPTLAAAFVERYSWYGTVNQAYSGKEQRMSLNDIPKISYTYRVQVMDRELQLFNAQMWGWQNRVWAVPVWNGYAYTSERVAAGDVTVQVQSTVGREFRVGGLALIFASAEMYEAVEVLEVHPTQLVLKKPTLRAWTRRVKVIPIRNMRMNREIAYSSPVANFREVDIGFISEAGEEIPSVPWGDTYKAAPVLAQWPDTSGPMTGTYTRNMDWDEGEYSLPLVVDKSGVGTPKQVWQYTFDSREEVGKFKALLQSLRGTTGEFWAYSWTPDLTLFSVVEPGANFILVQEAQQVNMYFDRRGRSDLVIILRDGSHIRREITNVGVAPADAPGSELFILDSPIDRRIRPQDVYLICYMTLSRFENEAFEFNWKTEDWASISVMIKGLTDGV